MTDAAAAVDRVFRQEAGRAVAALIRIIRRLRSRGGGLAGGLRDRRCDVWPSEGHPGEPPAPGSSRRPRTARSTGCGATGSGARRSTTPHGSPPSRPSETMCTTSRTTGSACSSRVATPRSRLDARVALTLRTVGGLSTQGDRSRVPCPGADARSAADPSETEDPGGRDPVPHPASRGAAGASGRRARRALPRLQRRVRGDGRASCSARSSATRRSGSPGWSTALIPGEPEVAGLLALMLLQHARRAARTDAVGDLVCWRIRIVRAGIRRCSTKGSALEREERHRQGAYLLQARIAACHARAPRPEDTDWPTIARSTGSWLALGPSPVVELNRAVAIAMADGPDAGLRQLEPLAADLDRYHLFHSARADLLRRAGQAASADAYGVRSTSRRTMRSGASSSGARRARRRRLKHRARSGRRSRARLERACSSPRSTSRSSSAWSSSGTGAEPQPPRLEGVHDRGELRLLRLVGLALRLAAGRGHRDRAAGGDRGGPSGGSTAPHAGDGGRRGGDARAAPVLQVLRLLHRERDEHGAPRSDSTWRRR